MSKTVGFTRTVIRVLFLGILLGFNFRHLYAGGQSGGSPEGTGKKTEIKVWANVRHDLAFRTACIERFNAGQPDINVVYEVFTDNYFNTLELSFQSGQAPDIFLSAFNPILYYVERNMVQPIDKYLSPQFREKMGEPFSIDGVNTVDGKQYTFSENGVTHRLVYNKEIFRDAGIAGPPRTMDEYYATVKKITEWGRSRGIYGTAQHFKTPMTVSERVFEQVGFRNGITPYNFNTGRYDFSVMKPVLDYFRRMYAEGLMFPGTEAMESDMVRAQFADGKVGMYLGTSHVVSLYAKNGQFPAKQEWGVAPHPGLKDPEPRGKTKIWRAGNSWAISSACKNPDAAWKFLEFIFNEDNLTAYQEGGYGFVAMPAAAKRARAPEGMIGFKECSVNPDLDRVWPVPPDALNMTVEGRRAYEIYVAIVLGAVDMDAGLGDLTSRYNAALEKGVANGTVKRIIDPAFDPAK
jgi:multiple sugar transport system substrate-binding protein